MNARVLWLGPGAVGDSVSVASPEALPDRLDGALVVHASPLGPDGAARLVEQISERGGRFALALGQLLPPDELAARGFFFLQDQAPEELARQLEDVAAHVSKVRPTLARFRFRTLTCIEGIAQAVSALLPSPQRRVLGLTELLLNAYEHGSLGISVEKQELLATGKWFAELERREREAPWCHRHVDVEVLTEPDGWKITITDQGDGFDYQRLGQPGSLHGRGIELARKLSFDSVWFEGRGNIVVARVVKP
ncbi:MAG: ATP-binding protein [Archangium sp.]